MLQNGKLSAARSGEIKCINHTVSKKENPKALFCERTRRDALI